MIPIQKVGAAAAIRRNEAPPFLEFDDDRRDARPKPMPFAVRLVGPVQNDDDDDPKFGDGILRFFLLLLLLGRRPRSSNLPPGGRRSASCGSS